MAYEPFPKTLFGNQDYMGCSESNDSYFMMFFSSST